MGQNKRNIATKKIHNNGISDVQVISTSGLPDENYNPSDETVNLSEEVYVTNNSYSNYFFNNA